MENHGKDKNKKQKNYFLLLLLIIMIGLVYFATVIKLSNVVLA